MNKEEIINLSQKYLMNTYRRFPVAWKKGKGVYLWDAEGKKYLDFLAGIAVNTLGYNHPRLVYTLTKLTTHPLHVSNLYEIPEQIELAQKLVELSFPAKVFFCNSGTEANEAAVKLARKWGNEKFDQPRNEILTATQSFHGRTLSMIAASGQERLLKGFDPLPQGFRHIPFGDEKAALEAVRPETCAIMVEPIQGEGGIQLPSPNYLKALKDICQEHHILLILDEVQCGIGRTGKMFAYEHYGVVPDIVTLAKGLGGGVPIGAVLAREFVSESFTPGSHGSTFGGNPLVTSVAKQVLTVIKDEDLLERCSELGNYFLARLKEFQDKYKFLHGARGLGLMLAIDLDHPARPIVEKCLERGLIINAVQEKTLRFLPPLIINQKQIDEGLEILQSVFEEMT
jgi:predicted acetylornithine/succinylornithine family transaminase